MKVNQKKLEKILLNQAINGDKDAEKRLIEIYKQEAEEEKASKEAKQKEAELAFKERATLNENAQKNLDRDAAAKKVDAEIAAKEKEGKRNFWCTVVAGAGTVIVGVLNFIGKLAECKSNERQIDALTEFESTGVPTSLTTKTVIQRKLK